MNFSLDWDGTVTSEPKGFAAFVNTMRSLGHKVYIVTMRYQSEIDKDPTMQRWLHGVDGIIATNRRAKQEVLDELGIKIDVFIDDNPRAINESAREIWGTPSPEGTVVTIDHNTGEHVSHKFPEVKAGNSLVMSDTNNTSVVVKDEPSVHGMLVPSFLRGPDGKVVIRAFNFVNPFPE